MWPQPYSSVMVLAAVRASARTAGRSASGRWGAGRVRAWACPYGSVKVRRSAHRGASTHPSGAGSGSTPPSGERQDHRPIRCSTSAREGIACAPRRLTARAAAAEASRAACRADRPSARPKPKPAAKQSPALVVSTSGQGRRAARRHRARRRRRSRRHPASPPRSRDPAPGGASPLRPARPGHPGRSPPRGSPPEPDRGDHVAGDRCRRCCVQHHQRTPLDGVAGVDTAQRLVPVLATCESGYGVGHDHR
jgi:hypothetical protein